MTKASWKSILQNAGSEFPGDEQMHADPYYRGPETMDPYGRPVRRQPTQPQRYSQPQQQVRGLGDLERELQNALKRAPRMPEPRPAPPRPAPQRPRQPMQARQQAPIPNTMPVPANMEHRRVQLPALYMPPQPVPLRPADGPNRRKGGLRNLVAISLSAAVVGFAAHEVSVQWHKSRAGMTRENAVAQASVGYRVDTGKLYSASPAKQASVTSTASYEKPVKAPKAPIQATISESEDVQMVTNTRMAAYIRSNEMQTATLDTPQLDASNQPTADTTASIENTEATFPEAVEPRAASRSDVRPVSATEEESLMQRAMAHMEQGDIAAARLFFRHLADRNSALGAISLAKTYDSKYIASFNVKGIAADPAQARKWYKRAAELGSREAFNYLSGSVR